MKIFNSKLLSKARISSIYGASMAFSLSRCHYVLQATLSTCVQRKTQSEIAKQ
jgi:hypothetical protein